MLSQLKLDFFDQNYIPPERENPDAFKVYELVKDDKNLTLEYLTSLKDRLDKKNAMGAFKKLLSFAELGDLFHAAFDKKKLHPSHVFKYRAAEKKIWRLWLVGDIRIYFVYMGQKSIVILNTAPKRAPKLSEEEKNHLSELATQVLDCFDARLVTIIKENDHERISGKSY